MSFQKIKITDCCKIVSGSTPRRNVPEYWNGNILWVTPKDISKLTSPYLHDTPEKISQKGYDSCSTVLLPKGSVLLSSRAPIGHIAIACREMCTNQGFKSLVPLKNIDSLYLYYCIKSMKDKIVALGTGSTFKEISKEVLSLIKIPLPPLDIQKKIAAVLDKADRLRQLRKQAMEKLDKLAESVFLDMFGDPVTNPKGWEIKKLQDISEIVSGVTKGKKYNGKELINIPYMRVANVQDGFLDLSEIKTISVTFIEAIKYKLKYGDILLTEGGDPDKLGRGCVWRNEIEECIYQNHIFRVRVNKNIVLPEFLSSLVGSNYGKKYFLRESKQTTGIATINSRQLKKFPVLIPKLDLQKKFQFIYNKIRTDSQIFLKSFNRFNNLFNSLLQRAFKGELEFNDEYFDKLEKEKQEVI